MSFSKIGMISGGVPLGEGRSLVGFQMWFALTLISLRQIIRQAVGYTDKKLRRQCLSWRNKCESCWHTDEI